MKAAVLGSPITHSLSPVLHRAAYQALSLTGWSYQAIECDTARLPGVLDGCGPGWAGLFLGGGATACSALAAVRGLGAAQATAPVRDPARAQDLLAAAARLAIGLTLTDFGKPEVTAPDVLISTVPAGA